MEQHLLTIIILLPVAGALALVGYSLLPSKRESNYKWIALAFSVVDFGLSLLLVRGIGAGTADFRFVEDVLWIGSIGAHYHLGVDGISLWLVLLTTLLMPISILSSWTAIQKRQLSYYMFLLLLLSAMIGVFVSLDLLLFYLFFADVLPDRNLGRRTQNLRGSKILYLYSRRQFADAGRHNRAVLHVWDV
jgi:NADH-quinone oxidoreductase subunit M